MWIFYEDIIIISLLLTQHLRKHHPFSVLGNGIQRGTKWSSTFLTEKAVTGRDIGEWPNSKRESLLRRMKEDTHWCLYSRLLVHFAQWPADPGSRLLRELWRKFLLSRFLGCLIFGLSANHLPCNTKLTFRFLIQTFFSKYSSS